ncbi:MAG: hypothetical protein ABW321_27410 [Polyangiales bacterium]
MSVSESPKGGRLAPSSPPERSALPAPEPPTIAFEADGCVMAGWRNVTIAVWGTQGTMVLVSELTELARRQARQYPRISSVHLVVNQAPLPTSDARAELQNLTAQYDARLVALVTMIEGTGFWASAMRSFITGMHVLERRSYKIKTCSTPHEVGQWLAGPHSADSGVEVSSEQLERVLLDLLARPSLRKRDV